MQQGATMMAERSERAERSESSVRLVSRGQMQQGATTMAERSERAERSESGVRHVSESEVEDQEEFEDRKRRRTARFATALTAGSAGSVDRQQRGLGRAAGGAFREQGAASVVASDPFRPSTVAEGIGVSKELPAGAEAKISEIVAGMRTFFGEDVPVDAVRSLAVEAYTTLDETFAEEEAQAWGDGFVIPSEAVAHDEALLRSNGNDYIRMAQQRHQLLREDRFNEDRVREVLSAENPERDKMLSLAAGMDVPLPEGFQPNGKLNYLTGDTATTYHAGDAEPLRTRYQQTASAVDKQLFKLWGLGLAFILTAPTVFWMVKGDHKMVASWAPKAATEAGRVLMDPTHTKVKGGSSMNGPEVKEKCKERQGAIEHPDIAMLVVMVVSFFLRAKHKDPSVKWEDLRLTKMDLRAAFTLLSVAPENTPLFTMNLTGGLVILVLCGLFGWTGTPFAFQVVTRAILFELLLVTLGDLRMYVDDIMGVCFVKDLEAEQESARRLCTRLLGPRAIAEDKTESGRKLVFIGYSVDLDKQLVNLSPRNLRKCFYAFFTVPVDGSAKVPIKTLERLSSLAERYSDLYPHMRPFQRALYDCHKSQRGLSEHISVDLTAYPEAVRAIRMWRVMLCAGALHEDRFAMSFQSFMPKTAEYVVEFDGCLSGVGILVYKRVNGTEVLVGGAAMDLRPLGFGTDSAFQNLGEFSGPVVTPVVLRRLGLVQPGTPCVVHFRGDSITGLKWAETRRFKGTNVSNSAVVFTAMVVEKVIEVEGTTHIPAAENKRADGLSRDRTMAQLGMGGLPFIDLDTDETAVEIRRLCDPALDTNTDESFAEHWGHANRIALSLC